MWPPWSCAVVGKEESCFNCLGSLCLNPHCKRPISAPEQYILTVEHSCQMFGNEYLLRLVSKTVRQCCLWAKKKARFSGKKNKYKDEHSIKMSYGLLWHPQRMSRVIALFKQEHATQNRWHLKSGSVFPGLSTMREPSDKGSVNRRGLVSGNQGVLSAHSQSKKQLEYVSQGLEPHGWY